MYKYRVHKWLLDVFFLLMIFKFCFGHQVFVHLYSVSFSIEWGKIKTKVGRLAIQYKRSYQEESVRT